MQQIQFQLLDTVRSTDKITDYFRELPARVQNRCRNSREVFCQSSTHPESFGMVNLVDCDAVHLRRPFLDKMESKIDLQLNVADVIYHGIQNHGLQASNQ